ncbi:hypothetical protein SAMN05421505_16215 [Sinosporangium album]|uniref:Uncharacterized protein n=1 Tax=Sinosporangium album TaxID=504805 RepID=A0A1G8L6S2_9ACTN|nr:hypothetical protein [Sinosporangium album]SDI51378.1 hypothetical protein SAMN05421505_16215 [Sinosporangium album]
MTEYILQSALDQIAAALKCGDNDSIREQLDRIARDVSPAVAEEITAEVVRLKLAARRKAQSN